MPIVRSNSKILYFAHVPKCAGTAVETYLAARFGDVAFQNTRYLSDAPEKRWSRTSPQHIALRNLYQLFPPGFFDHSFAVVRHPVSRVISAWHFQLEIERTVPQGLTFAEWLADLEDLHAEKPFVFDNHTRPMVDFIPDDAEIFRLEDGLGGIVDWLDGVTGDSGGPRSIGETNQRKKGKAPGNKVVPTPTDLRTIGRLFAADFERFGYEIGTDAPSASKTENTTNGKGLRGLLGRIKRDGPRVSASGE